MIFMLIFFFQPDEKAKKKKKTAFANLSLQNGKGSSDTLVWDIGMGSSDTLVWDIPVTTHVLLTMIVFRR